MSYQPHKSLSDPARPSASLIRLAGGVAVFVAMVIGGGLLVGELIWALLPAERQHAWFAELAASSTPTTMLINLYAFGILIAALAIAMRLVHQRRWISVIGAPTHALSQFMAVTKGLVLFQAVLFLLPAPAGLEISLNMAVGLWVMYLPLTLLGVLIQTGAEELIFRGYLQSQLAARFKSPKVWLLLPSVVFGLLHFNPNVDETAAWIVVFWAFCFGLIAADLTARSGTLGPAIALHFVNNVMIMALVAAAGDFDGLALFNMPFDLSDTDLMITWMPVEFLILLCSWLAARLALRV